MSKPKVEVTIRLAKAAIAHLSRYRSDCRTLPVKYQMFIGEMIFLRLFSLFEAAIEELACKLASGAAYANGKAPSLLCVSGSIKGAQSNVVSYNRKWINKYPKWNQAYQIEKNLKHMMDPKDPFLAQASIHGASLKEMLSIRNHLAHRNTGTAKEYRKVVQAEYGGHTRIAPGPFLLSDKRSPKAKIDVYLTLIPIILEDLASGK